MQNTMVEPIDEAAWQQAATKEDRRFWTELEPNLQPNIAESIRRMFLRHAALRRRQGDCAMELEAFFGVLLVEGLAAQGDLLPPC